MAVNWLITGAGGQLGSVVLRSLVRQGIQAVGLCSPTGPRPTVGEAQPADLRDLHAWPAVVKAIAPTHILHAAAITSIQAAYENPAEARLVNGAATGRMVEIAAELRARLVFTSTDLVFDGTAAPYSEDDAPRPLSTYGRTKAEAETLVRRYERGAVLRIALMYGLPAVERPATFQSQIAALRADAPLKLFEDEYRTPIWLEDAAAACVAVGHADFAGLLHVAGPQRLSRLDMGRLLAAAIGSPGRGIAPTRQSDLASPEPRPGDVSLCTDRFAAFFKRPCAAPMADCLCRIAEEISHRDRC